MLDLASSVGVERAAGQRIVDMKQMQSLGIPYSVVISVESFKSVNMMAQKPASTGIAYEFSGDTE